MRQRIGAIFGLALLGTASLAAWGDDASLPTADALRKQVEAGQYRDALPGLQRVLDLKGAAAAPYDRPEMLILRAECQLQLHQTKQATDSLDLAIKEATAGGPVKRDRAWEAMALEILIQKSPSMVYTPKTSTTPIGNKGINILDRTSRVDAFKALFADELPAGRQLIRHAETATTMNPVLDAAKTAAGLMAIEKAGTGATDQSKELASELASRGAMLMGSALNDMGKQVDQIGQRANEVYYFSVLVGDSVSGTQAMQQVARRRGPNGTDTQTLQGMEKTCGQIASAAQDLEFILASEPEKLGDVAKQAGALNARMVGILGDNYNVVPK